MSTIDASVREAIVRQLGAALADRWRRDHRRDDGVLDHQHDHQLQIQEEEKTLEGAAEGASTPAAAV